METLTYLVTTGDSYESETPTPYVVSASRLEQDQNGVKFVDRNGLVAYFPLSNVLSIVRRDVSEKAVLNG